MTKESNLPPSSTPEKPREPLHILFNAPWAHIRGGLNRSGREADLSYHYLAAILHNALRYTSIPHTPSRRKKKMEHHISREGSVMQSMERRAFVEFNMTNWGKVCSSLLAVPVTHIQWGALCGPASPVRYTAHCASHWFTVKTTWLFIQHVADKPAALCCTQIYTTQDALQRQQGGPTTMPQWYTHQLPVSRWATIRWNDNHGDRIKSRKKSLIYCLT